MAVEDEYWAWCLDEAVWAWGNHVKSQVEEAAQPEYKGQEAAKRKKEERRRQQKVSATFDRVLGLTDEVKNEKGFVDPATFMRAPNEH